MIFRLLEPQKNLSVNISFGSAVTDLCTGNCFGCVLPVSKVSFGFASAGTDFDGKNAANKDLFGGGAGAGVNIQPVAFLVVKDGCVRTIQLTDGSNSVDRALAMLPELVEKVSALVSKKGEKPADEAPKAE